jgi:FkbM family methyltransferase
LKTILTAQFEDICLSGYETDYVIQTIIQKNNFYEIETLSKWFPYFKDAEYIFDIGANLGNHSVYFAKKNKKSHVFAFEPFPDNYELLKKNIDGNELSNVALYNEAVGKHVGHVQIKEFDESNYGGTSFMESSEGEGSIRMTSVDNAIIDLSIPRLDFIKIDTEGFEQDIIQGMSYTIEEYHPIIWVECSDSSIKEVYRILMKAGYSLFDVEGANVLFIHGTAENLIDLDDILAQRFMYLKKTNTYYANYLKSKEWLSERNNAYKKLNEDFGNAKNELQEQKEKYHALNGEHIKCKKFLFDSEKKVKDIENKFHEKTIEYDDIKKKFEEKTQVLAEKNELLDSYRNKLKDAIVLVYDNEEALMNAKRQIEDLQNKIKSISNQLAEDERKLGIIHNHWYWRMGLNFYLWLKKIKHKVMKRSTVST